MVRSKVISYFRRKNQNKQKKTFFFCLLIKKMIQTEFTYCFQDFPWSSYQSVDVFDLESHLLQKLEASFVLPLRLNEL